MNPILFGFLSLVYLTLFMSGTLARLYLFAHTLNQILFGTCCGVGIAYFMHYYTKKPLYKHLTKIQYLKPAYVNYGYYVRNATILFLIS